MKINIFAGEGGHLEQAKRLKRKLSENGFVDVEIYSDSSKGGDSSEKKHHRILPISKFSKNISFFLRFFSFIFMFFELFRFTLVLLFSRSRTVVLLGPMMCVPILFACLLTNTSVMFIETWSRFESPSKTGKLCAKVGIRCFYQNDSLFWYYSKFGGRFIGRL